MLSAVKSVSPEDAREAAAFGPRLRRLRKITGLTLKELSDRAGLATSTISKIENDRMSPTYDVLLKLAAGLAIDLSSLLEGPATVQASGRLDVTRAAERRKHPTGTYVYEPFATGLTRKGMDPTVVRVTARSIDEFPDLIRHPGEELVFVISGTVELHAEFYAPIRLEAGDSAYYDATMGHAYISVSPEDATILNIVCGTGGVPPVELPGAQR
ncbi:helix-turn-helix domain-containing protein [Mesorhizobium sp. 1B3]|uniref:helix-turn-helix domain-containing protein n=1 Tax=Mesorhizobium sp. 1B3 TaxID=3243599 RepID=UPI003D95A65B